MSPVASLYFDPWYEVSLEELMQTLKNAILQLCMHIMQGTCTPQRDVRKREIHTEVDVHIWMSVCN